MLKQEQVSDSEAVLRSHCVAFERKGEYHLDNLVLHNELKIQCGQLREWWESKVLFCERLLLQSVWCQKPVVLVGRLAVVGLSRIKAV